MEGWGRITLAPPRAASTVAHHETKQRSLQPHVTVTVNDLRSEQELDSPLRWHSRVARHHYHVVTLLQLLCTAFYSVPSSIPMATSAGWRSHLSSCTTATG